VTGLRTGMSFGAVSHLRCAVSGFTPAVCHGLGAVPRRAVCRDGVADGRVLHWFTLQYCKTYGGAPTPLFLFFLFFFHDSPTYGGASRDFLTA
jgi:hypothetical protein